eukprot:CAMPEP_0119338238 /NCGR_PEP_ID=MMETSP1333-20130426/95620_1 /TAXON_ID=418940 /ORGANISM="Scyphosphaera apsteinii, Strain RCC1455" /LENGTH=58 /DNA_ID=CAMNT_0007349463 /DNA_START=44 /DNA_END=217 /DNA_ORIENTATION=-
MAPMESGWSSCAHHGRDPRAQAAQVQFEMGRRALWREIHARDQLYKSGWVLIAVHACS